MASEPKPPLHSATKIARPSFLIAFEQFQSEDKEWPKVSLLASLPVLIIMVLCWPISLIEFNSKILVVERVWEGWPMVKSIIPSEFEIISIAWISKLSTNFFASVKLSVYCPGVGRLPCLFAYAESIDSVPNFLISRVAIVS